MYNPVSTYRLQFHKGFTFKDLEAIVPYLEQLGIGAIYASPIFKAVPGSMHGYDGVDPLQLNPEIGTLEQLRELRGVLKAKGIGWVQDIVPNHLAFHSDNAWLMDVLEKGPASSYFDFFDIYPVRHLYQGPLMVPFLGAALADVIRDGELQVIWHRSKLQFEYAGNTWPLCLSSYETLLNANSTMIPLTVASLLANIGQGPVPDAVSDELIAVMQAASLEKGKSDWLSRLLKEVNRDQTLLEQLAGQQYYRLCSWQETDKAINYRRFFTVNGLICLNIQRPEVFAEYHRLIGQLVKEELFDGLRVDHIDGLFDPEHYLRQLRQMTGPDIFISVEKILGPGESMPGWPVQGNTGYDLLGTFNNLLTGRKGEKELAGSYKEMVGEQRSIPEQITVKKRLILGRYMAGELENLTHLFASLALVSEAELEQVAFDELKQAIGEFLVACPVYRWYENTFPLPEEQQTQIKELLSKIKKERTGLAKATGLLEKALLEQPRPEVYPDGALYFYQRCMQFTGPLMAKGVEDTLMYTEDHFILHNEVGDSPAAAGLSVRQFHERMKERQEHWPLSMNATATHDTKRGEDVRARLQVLPDLAGEWLAAVKTWQAPPIRPDAIAVNDAYFIYQTLLGVYPMPGEKNKGLKDRLSAYLEKTLREGKEHSDWAEPDLDYEAAVKAFAAKLMVKKSPFWQSFEPFFNKVADLAVVNSLAQVLLKFTCPGVPDVYQGCEHWDLSMVDPDNRRPVNYRLNQKLLSTLSRIKEKDLPARLWKDRLDGRIKIWLTRLLMQERKKSALLFERAAYIPLKVAGKYSEHILAFARQHQQDWYVTVVPLGLAALTGDASNIQTFDWEDTRVTLPDDAPADGRDLLANNRPVKGKEWLIAELFTVLPMAFVKLGPAGNDRGAGVLLPLSALPSPFGIGDLGEGAKSFAATLHECGQRYWQMLPLGPVTAEQQFSPYSSYSSFAGNAWYISPDLLIADGLLAKEELARHTLPVTAEVDHLKAAKLKERLLNIAWAAYQAGAGEHLQRAFAAYCEREDHWLTDHALFVELRRQYDQEPWSKWPEPYKLRDRAALKSFCLEYADNIEKEKWVQFLFDRQLKQLKVHCNALNIRLFGDLPFYVSYDSADVWANRELFALDANGEMQQVAGVPPDHFSAGGQLWGMPVFNWRELKKRDFDWWVRRIKKNLEYFGLLRLDHFRAFSSYWAVPAAETTAINGAWLKAPGDAFFTVLKKELGSLPLVAEDLGDIDAGVYALRDKFGLAGMKVLQFAWGDDMPASPHSPHNYSENFIAYTGTHDNNTTKGWYRQETDKAMRERLRSYTGEKVKTRTINKVLIKMVLSSVARVAIIPLQDWLDLDERARLNTPAATQHNWTWRLSPKLLAKLPRKRLKKWTAKLNRAG